ncbi:MAG: ATP phosphoribosyltransferase [Arcticibacterium sp.]|jgi:ATP phosphoribosyltransferase
MSKLKIAIQKSGRLSDDSVKLFKACGIKFEVGKSKLMSESKNFPAEFLFLRDDDIPGYVEDGVADAGIVGDNVLMEYGKDVNTVKKLGFSKCRLSLAVGRDVAYTDINYFEGKSIATSYPKILGDYLKSKNVKAQIHFISGSVEIAPGIGLAEGVCDIVSTGGTLLSNGLKEVEPIFNSEAVLIANKGLSDKKLALLDRIVFRMNAVQTADTHKYVLLNAPNDKIEKIISVMPGMRSPTITPLAQKGWSSIHSVLKENDFWENIEEMRNEGAEGILVIPIEKMIF